ncbi:unnamed protein product [Gordionus sp. m RMFG-2023]|uniref:homologous-pairing protein 2 homolog isoform X2 n=1 Tax=Gordionus sp. m RMFG-2023 TaxID=3053472 RepID=UPI0030E37FB6
MSKKDNEAEDTVLEFINKHNRPYSATDISNFMQKDFGKTAIIRALDNLVNKKLIIEKLYGKQKVFMPDQEKLPVVQDSELKTLDIQINELSEKLKDSKNEMKLLESQLKNFETSLSIAEARVLFDKTEKERTELNSKLESIKSNEVIITVEERTKEEIGIEEQPNPLEGK